MLDQVNEASKALASWPVVQAFFLIVIAFLGIMAKRWGERARNNVVEIPSYLMSGPVHDAMGALHDIAEECRTTNSKLGQMIHGVSEIAKEQRQQTQLLEFIRNNQEMRGDPQPPPNSQRLKRGI